MRWAIVLLLAVVAVLVNQVSALFFPIITSTGTTTAAATTTSLTVGTGSLALGGLAIAGIIGLGLAAALLGGEEEEPSYGYHAPAPSYHAPAPSYKAPAPSYKAPAPSYKAPAHKAPAPTYHAPAPSHKAPSSHSSSSYGSPHRRGKRSSEFDRRAEEMFTMVAQVDSFGCGMRLVCQVFQKRLEDLTPRERAIKRFIGEKPLPVSDDKVNEPKSRYISAAILGLRDNNCYEIYESCPLSDADVKTYLLNLESNLVGEI